MAITDYVRVLVDDHVQPGAIYHLKGVECDVVDVRIGDVPVRLETWNVQVDVRLRVNADRIYSTVMVQ